jgi:hypothetical protein
MPEMSRREVAGLLASLPLTVSLRRSPVQVERALQFQNGVADLENRGNTGIPAWTGCPPEALAKPGVAYEGER